MQTRTISTLGHFAIIASLLFLFSPQPLDARTCTPFQRLFGCVGTPPAPTLPPAPASPTPIVPTFDKVNQITLFSNGHTVIQPINSHFYASLDTANSIMTRFGAARVETRPDPVTPGGYNLFASNNQPAFTRVLIFTPGSILRDNTGAAIGLVRTQFEINAGQIADFFFRNPEKDFPPTSYIFGFPPQTFFLLSRAEADAWDALFKFAANANNVAPVTVPAPSI